MSLLPPLLVPSILALVAILFHAHDSGYGLVPITPGMVRHWKIHAIVPTPSPGSVLTASVVDPVVRPTPTPQILVTTDSDGFSNSTAGSEEHTLPDPRSGFFKVANGIFGFLIEFAWLAANVLRCVDDYFKTNPEFLELVRTHNADMEALEALTVQSKTLEDERRGATIAHQAEVKLLRTLLRMATEDRLTRVNKLKKDSEAKDFRFENLRQEIEEIRKMGQDLRAKLQQHDKQIENLYLQLAKHTSLPDSPRLFPTIPLSPVAPPARQIAPLPPRPIGPRPPPQQLPPPAFGQSAAHPAPPSAFSPPRHALPARPPPPQHNLPPRPPPTATPLRPQAATFHPSHNIDVQQRQRQNQQQWQNQRRY